MCEERIDMEEIKGNCVLCKVVGRGEKNFVCEKCGHPEKIISVCRRCGTRVELTRCEPEVIKRLLSLYVPREKKEELTRIEISAGVSISTPICSSCIGKRGLALGDVSFYRVKKPLKKEG